MSRYGILVVDWPLGLGCDSAGIITDSSNEATEKYGLKAGDEVFGCTRLGIKGYAAGQEYHLFDAQVTLPKPKNISLQDAATLGVSSLTAALGLYDGLRITLPDPKNLPAKRDEWLIVLGGASSVGKAAIQLAKASGYNVVASSSPASAGIVKDLGAEHFSYKDSVDEQVKMVQDITSGKFSLVYDAVAADDPVVAKELFKASSSAGKIFATTGNWTPALDDFEGGKTYNIQIGEIGRPGAEELNSKIEKYVPVVVGLIETGQLKPAEYEAVGEGGLEGLIAAYRYQASGAGGSRKVIAKIQDP